nr:hypothetical protein [Tanacetum cinerariifolium]
MVPAAVLTQSKPVPITTVRPVSTVVLKISVTRPRHANIIVTKPNSPTRNHINHSPSTKVSTSPSRVTAAKASVVNAAQGMQGKWEWKPKCLVLDHVPCNTSASMTLKSDESLPPRPLYDRYQSGNGYHVVPSPYTGTFMPPKPDLVFNHAPNDVETNHPTFTVKLSPSKPDQDLSLTNRPSAPITKDWVSDLEDESETKTLQNVLKFV